MCICASPRSLLHFPDGVYSAHVSEFPLTRQVVHTDCISFFDLLSQIYTWKLNSVI